MHNINSITNTNSTKILFNRKPETTICNYIKKTSFLLSSECQISNIIHQAKIKKSISIKHSQIDYGTSKETFKLRYVNHEKCFYHKQHRKETELSNEYWRLKELNASPEIDISFLKKYPPTRIKGACYLCIYQKP